MKATDAACTGSEARRTGVRGASDLEQGARCARGQGLHADVDL